MFEELDVIIESYRTTPNRWDIAGMRIVQADNWVVRDNQTGVVKRGVSVWEVLVEGDAYSPIMQDFDAIANLILCVHFGEERPMLKVEYTESEESIARALEALLKVYTQVTGLIFEMKD